MSSLKKFVASLALSLAAVAVATPTLKAAELICWGCTYMGSGWDSELGFYDEYWCDGCVIFF